MHYYRIWMKARLKCPFSFEEFCARLLKKTFESSSDAEHSMTAATCGVMPFIIIAIEQNQALLLEE